ncbi:hypothetical protein [Streptomyces alkaliterrae]|uniref:DUF4878 domain-containing protein n=1 Tax=Streptomyces alkaliterrae TaxID=2213162 RepID=A0A5P0YX03_9ACTN|nr:hypothetical protein [Streptomyces alkaliterrae]MBB1253883.1 hypothetical protein [Streptomyces alkaliterrae]MBB1260152.1 hypothetical protein [Streptomyces alkaliterrae]MQS03019.1 hypothetical protein [Streptomyces alkaliterrae]
MTRRSGWSCRRDVVPLVLAGVLLSGACAASGGGPAGAESPRAAAEAYVEALNSKNGQALRDLFAPTYSEDRREAEASRLLGELGDGVRLKVVDVTQDVSPKVASLRLGGFDKSGDGGHPEYVQLTEDDGWWVLPADAGDGAVKGPTADTERPSS